MLIVRRCKNSCFEEVMKAPSLGLFEFARVTRSFQGPSGIEYRLLRQEGTGIYVVTGLVHSDIQHERHAFVFDSGTGRLLDNRVHGATRLLTSEDRCKSIQETRAILNSWMCSPRVVIEQVYHVHVA